MLDITRATQYADDLERSCFREVDDEVREDGEEPEWARGKVVTIMAQVRICGKGAGTRM